MLPISSSNSSTTLVSSSSSSSSPSISSSIAIWLSAAGYTSEVSTVLMNYRWYQLETLDENWLGFGITTIFVILSWIGRGVVLFPYLLLFIILPKTQLYIQEKQIFTYLILVSTHGIIGILSIYWLSLMLLNGRGGGGGGGGIKNLLIFNKKREKKNRHEEKKNISLGFSFGNDIGRNSTTTATATNTTTIRKDTTTSKVQEKEL